VTAHASPPPAGVPPEDPRPGAKHEPSLIGALIREARPKQWVKNLLVVAAPGAAGVLSHRTVLLHTVLAFVVFCLAASGTYYLNDVLDLEADRHHPTKRSRPVAAGVVPVNTAVAVGIGLLAMATIVAGLLGTWQLTLVVVIYVAVTITYTLYFKHEPILDLAGVAAGFVIRAIAGGVATRVPISQWFLIVASFGSLFMVAGKRSAEHDNLGEDRGAHRATLAAYSAHYLRYIRTVTSSVTLTAYALWAFEKQAATGPGNWFHLSIIPFTLAIFRYALLLDAGLGEAPEDIVLGDPTLLILGALWALTVALGVYVG
jgi:decaprenyl-phosphate phosphoribosyltransferase